MDHAHALYPVVLLLLVGVLAVTVSRPLRQSPIVGYLLGGALIGPHGLHLIEANHTLELLAELGVVFLLFDIGLHFSLGHLWSARRDILGLGPLQMLACTVVLGGLLLLAGSGLGVALVVGATLALSSTAVAVQTLAERGQQGCPVGRTATAVLVFQDICAIFLLILASTLGDAGAALGSAVGWAALKALLAFGAAMLAGRYLLDPLFNTIAAARNDEVFTAIVLLLVLLAAAATGTLGLSLTLGAFLAGMSLAETHYRHAIQTEIKPFRGLLLGFFFITVGMALDMAVLAQHWPLVLALLVGFVLLKALLVGAAALLLRLPLRSAVQIGLLLAQGSEFAFVIIQLPGLQTRLTGDWAAILTTVVAASLALTPPLTEFGYRYARYLARREQPDMTPCGPGETPTDTAPSVIVFGMGEQGRRVADALEAHGISYLALEMDFDRLTKANTDGYSVAYGDIGDTRLMGTLAMPERPTVAITIKRYEVSRDLTPLLRQRYPLLTRIIAVDDDAERKRFEALGMQAVVTRTMPAGMDLACAVLRQQGVDEERIRDWLERQQEQALAQVSVAA